MYSPACAGGCRSEKLVVPHGANAGGQQQSILPHKTSSYEWQVGAN